MKQLEFNFAAPAPSPRASRPKPSTVSAKAPRPSAAIVAFPNKRRVHLVRYAAEQMARLPPEFAEAWFDKHLDRLRREAWAEADIDDAVIVQREYIAAVRCLAAYLRADRGCRPARRREPILPDRGPCPVVVLRARAG